MEDRFKEMRREEIRVEVEVRFEVREVYWRRC